MTLFIVLFVLAVVAMVYGIVAISGDYAAQWTGTETRSQRSLRELEEILAETDTSPQPTSRQRKLPG